MAFFAELTSRARFRAAVERYAGRRAIELVRRAVEIADEGAESPPEVDLRLVWELDAGLSRPLRNPDVFSLEGDFLGRPDLLVAAAGLVGEYAGGHHLALSQRRRDLDREQRFRAHGLEYVSFVGGELTRRARVVERILAARDRAERSIEPRRWTLAPPPWWRSPLPLDERIEVRETLLSCAELRNVS